MKRGGHVAGRRCSRCLCDSVQIHPTLKRRMCTKRKRDESLGCTKLSSTAKNPPAAGQTPRHERMNHRERISTRVLFFHDNNKKKTLRKEKKKSFSSTTAVTAQCALRFSATGKSFCPLWLRRSLWLSNPHKSPTHSLRLSSPKWASPTH